MGPTIVKELSLIVTHPNNIDKLKEAFDKADTSKDGRLEKEEFTQFGRVLFEVDVELAQQEVRKALRGFAGSQAALEIAALISENNIAIFVEKMFNQADADKSGAISFDEFQAFLKKQAGLTGEEKLDCVKDGIGNLKISPDVAQPGISTLQSNHHPSPTPEPSKIQVQAVVHDVPKHTPVAHPKFCQSCGQKLP